MELHQRIFANIIALVTNNPRRSFNVAVVAVVVVGLFFPAIQ